MPWITKNNLPAHTARACKKPDSGKGTAFDRNSVWQCDICGRQWRFDGYTGQHGDMGPSDQWRELPSSASDPAETWSGLLVNLDDLDEDVATGKLTAFLQGPTATAREDQG
jgi:hypothetical protein